MSAIESLHIITPRVNINSIINKNECVNRVWMDHAVSNSNYKRILME